MDAPRLRMFRAGHETVRRENTQGASGRLRSDRSCVLEYQAPRPRVVVPPAKDAGVVPVCPRARDPDPACRRSNSWAYRPGLWLTGECDGSAAARPAQSRHSRSGGEEAPSLTDGASPRGASQDGHWRLVSRSKQVPTASVERVRVCVLRTSRSASQWEQQRASGLKRPMGRPVGACSAWVMRTAGQSGPGHSCRVSPAVSGTAIPPYGRSQTGPPLAWKLPGPKRPSYAKVLSKLGDDLS